MPILAFVFAVASLLWTAVALVLSVRQVRHVQRNRDSVPAAFAASVTRDDHQKAADYTVARERVARVETTIGLALSLFWAFGGIDRIYEPFAVTLPPSLGRGVAFLIAASVIGIVLTLPIEIYRAFVVEQRFGFNRSTVATFVNDHVKQWALSLAIAVPLLFACLWAMRMFTGLWWLWTWGGLIALMLLGPAVYVRLIAPRFNRFAPLDDGILRTRIEQLLARSGFRASGLFVMDASRRTAHGNAYFIGFGRTKRIVLFDTLLARSAPAEVEAVIAHELGHFRHHHVIFGLLRGAAITFAALAAFGWLCKQPWLLPSFGVTHGDNALSLFVCLQLFSVVGPLLAPLGNWISRRNEFQADAFARQAVGTEPMIGALTGLARDNASTLTPDPVYALMHYSHPPVPIRVRQLRVDHEKGGVASAAA